jgi:predicted permease
MSFAASLAQDLRWSLRTMRRNLGLTTAVVLSLGLTLGANTATFGVLNAFLLRPLAIEEIDRVVRLRENLAGPGQAPDLRSLTSMNYGAWRANQRVFTDIAVAADLHLTLTGLGDPERFSAARVSANFFPLLGVRPLLGRLISPDEDHPGHEQVVILSYDIWHGTFGGDPGVIGRAVTLNGRPYTVIGVMRRGYHHPYSADLWVPLAYRDDPSIEEEYYAPARLKPGVTLERARIEMNDMVRRLAQTNPQEGAPQGADLSPMRTEIVGDLDRLLFLLMAASTFVLLIACVNVSNLLLAQGSRQGGETAVRIALGATRGRLVQQALTYSLLLALLGAALGILLALWGMTPLVALSPAYGLGEFDIEPRLDPATLGFAFAGALAAGLLFGLVPALRLSRIGLRGTLQEGGRTRSMGLGGRRLLAGLVVAEVALSLVLLVGAGLIGRSFERLRDEDRGFDRRGVLSFAVPSPDAQLIRGILGRLREIPGVSIAGGTTVQPLYAGTWAARFNIEGKPASNERGYYMLHDRVVTPGYFEALRVPLVAGRFFDERDNADGMLAAIVSRSLAERYWPGESALGKRIKRGRYDTPLPWLTVVGVVGTLKEKHDEVLENDDAWYLPYAQVPTEEFERMTFTLRTKGDPLALVPAVRAAVHAVNKDTPVFDVMTMEQRFAERTAPERFSAVIYTALGILGLVLAAIGIYGVLAFRVDQRLREIGIRAALGAQPGELRKLVLLSGLRLAGIGLAIGAAGALAFTKLLSSQLYQVSPRDPVVLASALAVLAVISVVASYLPARRAAKIDPVSALRSE